MTSQFIKGLNPEQRAAVTHGDGPLLVVAGAGTGKTATITKRIAHLIQDVGVPGDQIAALTFTDAAATEMEDRLYDLLSFTEARMWVGTFHSFGRLLLERYAYHLGRSPSDRLIRRPEQLVLLGDRIDELPLDLLRPRYDPTAHLDAILRVISRLKNEDVSPERYLQWVKQEQATAAKIKDPKLKEARQAGLAKQAELAAAYDYYETLKAQQGVLDYDDQLTLPLQLMREHPDVRAAAQQQFSHLLVDEFQDTNVVQAELIYLVAGDRGNLTVVGDDDQAIYAFRGASLSNILEFEKRLPQATRIVLRQNYRSTQQILDAAYRMVRHNDPHRLEAQGGFDKRLTAEAGPGDPITLWQNAIIDDEAERIAELLLAENAEGLAWDQMAVLTSKHRDIEVIRQTLAARGIPVATARREYLYLQPEIKLALAALRVIDNPLHSSSLRILATSPLYSMPDDHYSQLERTESLSRTSVWEQLAETEGESAAKLQADIRHFQERAKTATVGEVLYGYLVSHTKYVDALGDAGHDGDAKPLTNLSTFFTSLKRFAENAADPSVHAWLEHFDHVVDLKDEATDEEDLSEVSDYVLLSTLHSAKGLEFELVIAAMSTADRLEHSRGGGLEPPAELLRDPQDKEASLRERRRLFYVAMTRAKRKLYLSYSHSVGGKRALRASGFIAEALGEQAAEVLAPRADPDRAKIDRLRGGRDLPGAYRPPDPLVLSHSSLQAFRECPWRYYWDYHVRVYLPKQSRLLFGDAVHAGLQYINQTRLEGGQPTAEAATQQFNAAWREEGYVSRKLAEAAHREGLAMVLGYLKESAAEPPPTAIEQPFKFKLGDFYLNGRYDRVDERDGQVRITDYKTSDVTTLEQAEKKLADPRNKKQLQLYSLAYRAMHNRLPDELLLCFPRSNISVALQPITKQLATLEEEIQGIAAKIMKGDFQHNPSEHECSLAACNRCPTNTLRNRGDF